jgi:hypothetical protein
MNRSSSPALRFGSGALVLVLATLFFGAGCGAASSPNAGLADAKMTTMAPQSPPQNLGEAEAQFASAEQNVFGALGQDKRQVQGAFAQPPGQLAQAPAPTTTATEASPPPPPKDVDRSREGEDRAAAGATAQAPASEATALSASPCETACRALASMDRAATHICLLAGDDNERCTNARERVRSATERVRQSCSECSGG